MAAGAPPPRDSRPRFLLLLHGSEAPGGDEARVVAAYRAWAGDLREQGRFVTGERLGGAAVAVPAPVASSVAAAEVQGYFVVSASDLEDATLVARSCPHVARGGRIVVRPIDALP
jgi:hypothetical protein